MADIIAILWADVIALNLLLDLANVMPIDNGMSLFNFLFVIWLMLMPLVADGMPLKSMWLMLLPLFFVC